MDTADFVNLLESVRDHLTLAIHDAQAGDTKGAVEHVEQGCAEMEQAAEGLRAA